MVGLSGETTQRTPQEVTRNFGLNPHENWCLWESGKGEGDLKWYRKRDENERHIICMNIVKHYSKKKNNLTRRISILGTKYVRDTVFYLRPNIIWLVFPKVTFIGVEINNSLSCNTEDGNLYNNIESPSCRSGRPGRRSGPLRSTGSLPKTSCMSTRSLRVRVGRRRTRGKRTSVHGRGPCPVTPSLRHVGRGDSVLLLTGFGVLCDGQSVQNGSIHLGVPMTWIVKNVGPSSSFYTSSDKTPLPIQIMELTPLPQTYMFQWFYICNLVHTTECEC